MLQDWNRRHMTPLRKAPPGDSSFRHNRALAACRADWARQRRRRRGRTGPPSCAWEFERDADLSQCAGIQSTHI